jgi:hypothetical protein
MNDAERTRIANNIALVKSLMPEMAPIIKELHEVGLIEGWRNVVYVGPPRPEPYGVTVAQMVLESVTETKERMKRGAH